jgi:hypothetical protein
LVGYQILNEESRFKFEAAFLFLKKYLGRSLAGQAIAARIF